MYRKNKVRLVGFLYIPLAFLVPLLITFYFTPYAVYFTKISYLFAPLCLITPFMAIGKWKVGGQNAKTDQPFLRWMLMIFIAEIGIVSIFIVQSNVLIQALIKMGTIYPSSDLILHNIWPSLLMNWGLFPWTFFAIVSAHFAYLGYTKNPHLTFSAHLLPRFKKFTSNIIRRIIDIYIQTTSRFFLLVVISCLALQICLFFYPKAQLFSPIYSILVGSLLLIVFSMQTVQNSLKRIEKQKRRQGIHLLLMFIISTLIILAITIMVEKLSPATQHFYQHFTLPFSQPKHPKSALTLWNWSFWILSVPFFCSLLVKFSQGRSVRQLLTAILVLPVALIALSPFLNNMFMNGLITVYTTHWIYLPLIISIVLFIYFSLDKEMGTYLWLGFIPVKKLHKTRRLFFDQLWTFFIVVLSLILLLNLSGCVLSAMLGAPICLIIFFLLLFHRTKSNSSTYKDL